MPDINIDCNTFNGLFTAFFTGLLALFGLLQLKAIDKQNKQNLFKLRMEHYIKYKNLILEIASLYYKEDDGGFVINKDMINKLINQIKISATLSEESKYLFNETTSKLYETIFKQLSEIRHLLENTNIPNIKTDIQTEIIEATDKKLDSEFDNFLSAKKWWLQS